MPKRKTRLNPSKIQAKVYRVLKKAASRGPVTADDLAAAAKLDLTATESALDRLQALGLAHPAGRSLFGTRWAPGAPQRSLFGNPAALFGSRERQAVYGDKYGGSRSGARADRVKALRAKYRKADTVKASLEREEARRRTAEGQAEARERAREAKAYARILDGGAYLMKVAPMDGKPLHRRDLEAFVASGWMVFPASQVSGKAGGGLSGWSPMTWNPTDALERALGRRGAARAVLVGSGHHLTKGDVDNWRGSGFDVSAAPAHLRSSRILATNPNATRDDTRPQGRADHGAMRHGTASASRNPKGLARVWTSWTGAAPSKVLSMKLEALGDGLKLPKAVVLLGRIKALVSPEGDAREWGDTDGPYLVTDEHARKAWLIAERPERLNMKVKVVSYLATKPKFGDRGTTEYVHEFRRPATASLEGQAGTLAGTFKITPRGIEG